MIDLDTYKESYLETVLALSTGHVPSNEPDFGQAHFIEYEHGWIVFVVDPDCYQEGDLPEWLAPIMKEADKRKCSLIRFDCDALQSDLFKEYEW